MVTTYPPSNSDSESSFEALSTPSSSDPKGGPATGFTNAHRQGTRVSEPQVKVGVDSFDKDNDDPFNPSSLTCQNTMPSKSKNRKSSPTVLRDVSLNTTPAPKITKVKEEIRVKQEVIDVSSTYGAAQGRERELVTRCKREESILSVDEAKSTVNAFFVDQERFTSNKENKLRFWQSLCVEFGLVKLEEPQLSVIKEEESDSDSDSDTDTDESDSDDDLPPLPQSLNKVKKLLKKEAHVNLKDYMTARANGQDLSRLVFPSAQAMIKYTRKHKRFVRLNVVKSEWLNPLLRTFNHKHK